MSRMGEPNRCTRRRCREAVNAAALGGQPSMASSATSLASRPPVMASRWRRNARGLTCASLPILDHSPCVLMPLRIRFAVRYAARTDDEAIAPLSLDSSEPRPVSSGPLNESRPSPRGSSIVSRARTSPSFRSTQYQPRRS